MKTVIQYIEKCSSDEAAGLVDQAGFLGGRFLDDCRFQCFFDCAQRIANAEKQFVGDISSWLPDGMRYVVIPAYCEYLLNMKNPCLSFTLE